MNHQNILKPLAIALLISCCLCSDLLAASNWFRLPLGESRESLANKQKLQAENQKKQAALEKQKRQAALEEQKKLERKAAAARRSEQLNNFKKGMAAVGHSILWYLPNRICDLVDCFTGEIGIGEIGVDLKLTRYAEFGAGIGRSYMTGWSINRQNGLYMQRNYYANFLALNASDTLKKPICGDYIPIYGSHNGTVDVERMLQEKAEDPFAIGVKAGCYVNFRFELHPVELADFIAGIFFIDFKGDDN